MTQIGGECGNIPVVCKTGNLGCIRCGSQCVHKGKEGCLDGRVARNRGSAV